MGGLRPRCPGSDARSKTHPGVPQRSIARDRRRRRHRRALRARRVQPLVDGFRRALDFDLKVLGQRGYDRFKQLYDVQKTHGQLQQVYLELLQNEGTPVAAKAGLQSDLSKNF